MTTLPAARFLMCRPQHFAVAYTINPWMDPETWARQKRVLSREAQTQWERLHGALTGLGAQIEIVPAVPGLPDLVFTANSAVVLNGTALLARFRHAERRSEEPHYEAAFRKLQARGLIESVRKLPDEVVLEGAGDCVFDRNRDLFWMGYGPRSDASARNVVAEIFDTEAVALELVDPRFYHMDTALVPLPGGEVMYVPDAFAPAGQDEIRQRVAPEHRIELAGEDALKLAANAVCIDDAVVLSACGEALRRNLAERGYRVIETPLGSFLRSGGSAFCLTLRLDRRSNRLRAASAA
jgi:N-dimethylarginine dimethylaminohydrolase